MGDPRRAVPRTDAVLGEPRIAKAVERLGRDLVKSLVAAAQERARAGEIEPGAVVAEVVARLPATVSSLRPVLNATGVLVHTNLGRAPLSAAALDAIVAAGGATDVEFALETGERAQRGRGTLAALAEAVPRAEAVHVVNNNAAALLLCALTLAPGKEIVVSRGELVEIGDGFRIPDLLASTGARLREVGTTNRTSAEDYASAIGPDTGFVLKIHPSNYQVTGFTSEAGVAELAGLGVPVVADVGSGLLAPHPPLPDEPDVTTALAEGANVVTASGDKLLGGPQAGLLFGDAELVQRLRRHPAARALRVDKLTLAALEATLRGPEPPVRAALVAEGLRQRAEALAQSLRSAGVDAEAVDSAAVVGGGGAPGVELPGAAVALPARYAEALRLGEPAVVGRIVRDRCLLDLRTVAPADDAILREAVRRCG
ncbi:L-seryl-tRNA(Sec) selenium transferase [Amycolatopsis rubida]|uniref:L-seryl-tRNA(Sec) selenium transferase n=1 Tax=Amycolatopsis rubida TaxID=112413 RepID=A0ABX0BVF6_9PSEU|nr:MULTISPECIES: L-seryl-tRNA(Sec) selenium transferase [Amycolatopsis]MYW93909.1 L-seryl-tRNA(Sec) selenium transferase [Amycolatopsis rubida]NEC58898.1 L-seryl-tRNA(Sec) selenium transferase [Amycolatopsis rubida]